MKEVKSAKGKVIDMNAIIQQNETTRAVGNGRMNARGDTIDSRGNVIKTVQAKNTEARKSRSAEHITSTSTVVDTISEIDKSSKKSEVSRKKKKDKETGSSYLEIQYDDGSFETIDIDSGDGNA